MTKSYICEVEGKVKGGNFKVWVLETAQRLGVNGWVRFLTDTKAEILLQGTAKQYEEFRSLVKSEAPVPDLKYKSCSLDNYDTEHEGFEMR